MRFLGVYNNSIDPKGRASIPARFRDELAAAGEGEERLVVTLNKGGLVAYPSGEWEKIMQRVEQLPAGQQRDDIYLTQISPAMECTFDKQGRIQLSQSQREYAGLDTDIREIVVVGMGQKIAIWSRARHAEMFARAEQRRDGDEANRQLVADLGF